MVTVSAPPEIKNVSELDAPATLTVAIPGLATKLAGMVASSSPEFTTKVTKLVPFQVTDALLGKLLPKTSSVNAALPAGCAVGTKVESVVCPLAAYAKPRKPTRNWQNDRIT